MLTNIEKCVTHNYASNLCRHIYIQNPVVESVGDNMISISLEFIEESSALGCFVVLEDHFSTEDTFVVLKQNAMDSKISQFQLQLTLCTFMILKIMHFLTHILLFLLFKLYQSMDPVSLLLVNWHSNISIVLSFSYSLKVLSHLILEKTKAF